VAILASVFVVSRVIVVALGVHFDVGFAGSAVQDLDPALLRHHLLQSLWYMHGQPPLWNAVLGLVLHVFPRHWPQVWHLSFLVLGLTLVLVFYALLRVLGLESIPSMAVAAGFSVSPAVLLYENQLFYDYPTVVVVTATALSAGLFVRRPTFWRALVVFTLAGALVLSRTLFQVWWLVLLVAVVLVACVGRRGAILVAAAVPLALVGGVYAKNIALYGVPSTTSWAGMGVARSAVMGLPPAERRRLVAAGKLHVVSLVKPLAPLADYVAVGIRPAPASGIPVLDEVSGPEYQRNLENKTYIRISRLYWKDDLWIVRHRPGAYLRAVGHGLEDFFTSPTVAWAHHGDAAKIDGYDRFVDRVAYGQGSTGKVGLLVVAAYCVALVFGLWVGATRLRPAAGAADVTIAVSALTILYVLLVGNVAEVGENYRFRLVVDPLAIALVAIAVQRSVRRITGRAGAATASG
jgi:hypothetical protein